MGPHRHCHDDDNSMGASSMSSSSSSSSMSSLTKTRTKEMIATSSTAPSSILDRDVVSASIVSSPMPSSSTSLRAPAISPAAAAFLVILHLLLLLLLSPPIAHGLLSTTPHAGSIAASAGTMAAFRCRPFHRTNNDNYSTNRNNGNGGNRPGNRDDVASFAPPPGALALTIRERRRALIARKYVEDPNDAELSDVVVVVDVDVVPTRHESSTAVRRHTGRRRRDGYRRRDRQPSSSSSNTSIIARRRRRTTTTTTNGTILSVVRRILAGLISSFGRFANVMRGVMNDGRGGGAIDGSGIAGDDDGGDRSVVVRRANERGGAKDRNNGASSSSSSSSSYTSSLIRRLCHRAHRIVEGRTVYVLELAHGRYYVGSTTDRKRRYNEHASRRGSKWTRMHAPLCVIEEYRHVPSRYLLGMESRITANLMLRYGVNNVRGSMFCTTRDYHLGDLDGLTRFLGHYNDMDYREVSNKLSRILPHPPGGGLSSSSTIATANSSRKWRRKYHHHGGNDNGGHDIRYGMNNNNNNNNDEDGGRHHPRGGATTCYKCGEVGHISANCPKTGGVGWEGVRIL